MKGFFTLKDYSEKKKSQGRARKGEHTQSVKVKEGCEACGLYKTCRSPKMGYTGQGKKKILIVAEAPGETEDAEGVQLIGRAGQLLRQSLASLGYDLDRDFWKTNSIICRPPNNRKPSKKELKLCRVNLEKTIDELKPKFIWLLGSSAVESFFFGRYSTVSMAGWRRKAIPEKEALVIPLYHPSFVLRNQDEKTKNIFLSDLVWALDKLAQQSPPPYFVYDKVEVLTEYDSIVELLNQIILDKKEVVFDYETNSLSPYRDNPVIHSIGICFEENKAYSFPFEHKEYNFKGTKIEELWKTILSSPHINIVNQNIKFEDRWSRCYFETAPWGWVWDTMVTQHILDCEPGTVGLKFQAHVRWGVEDYEAPVAKYKNSAQGSDGINKIAEIATAELCKYNAIDALVTRKLYLEQKEELRRNRLLTKGNNLFLEGLTAFCEIENNGICIDKTFYDEEERKLTTSINRTTKRLLASDAAELFQKEMGREINLASSKDLSTLLFDLLKIKPVKTTKGGGNSSVDKESLESINNPFTNKLSEIRKLIKIRDTYLAQFSRESYQEKLHPNFNLHTARTYRSSASNPNFQNIPVRDELAKKVTRGGIIPSKGNKLLEVDYCLEENTLIETIDGAKTIKDIVKNYDKQDIFVYCFNKDQDRIGVSKIIDGKLTGLHKTLLKVTLDNDKFILCTPEHSFMLRSGEYKEAKDLLEGESLMPFYSSIEKTNYNVNYKRIYLKGKSNSYRLAHNLIAEDVLGITIKGSNLVIHHKDSNGCNNSLSNLEPMTRRQHMSLHTKQSWSNPKKKRTFEWIKSIEGRKLQSKRSKEWWNSLSEADKKEAAERLFKNRRSYIGRGNPNFGKHHPEEAKKRMGKKISLKGKGRVPWNKDLKGYKVTRTRSTPAWNKGLKGVQKAWNKGKKVPLSKEQLDYRKTEEYRNKLRKPKTEEHKLSMKLAWIKRKEREGIISQGIGNNHKVTKVENWGFGDVYNITVENHHNFALSSGVIVKNSAVEVRVASCYTKDPELIRYIHDPSTDMHYDQAKKIWLVDDSEMTKLLRFYVKNCFVFPEFYGSWYKNCAANLWEEAKNLRTKKDIPMLSYLRSKGITSPESFEENVRVVESNFWKQFSVFRTWQENVEKEYMKKGYVEMMFGFRRSGLMSRNEIMNSPIQGTAFHCLLWSLIEIYKKAKNEKWKSKIIGQIHDSIIVDVVPEEEEYIIKEMEYIMCTKIREEHPFLIVPLEVEAELTPVDGSWNQKESVKKNQARLLSEEEM